MLSCFCLQYASLFVHQSWKDLLDGKEDDVTNDIVSRILKYLNSGDNRYIQPYSYSGTKCQVFRHFSHFYGKIWKQATVGIQLSDMSSNWMVISSLVTEWFVNWMFPVTEGPLTECLLYFGI